MLAFYQETLGFTLQQRDGNIAHLGAGASALITLQARHGAHRVSGTTGLYHLAILVPDRATLAQVLNHLLEQQVALQGFADHLVSEAIYLSDPEGNGIEVYCDRPREAWSYKNGQLQIDTLPLDLEDLLRAGNGNNAPWQGLPVSTNIGHVHLRVADLQETEGFYRETLGFDLVARYGAAASFFSAGGYHHHIGANTWGGRGAPSPPAEATGLRFFELRFPTPDARDAVVARARAADYALAETESGILVRDPAQNGVLLTAPTTV
jgi:catechol 2,3-dioxygenase